MDLINVIKDFINYKSAKIGNEVNEANGVNQIQKDNLRENKNIKNKENNNLQGTINYINENYKIPDISILTDEESKNIIPYIDKMKSEKGVNIPIGSLDNNIILENIRSMPNLLIGGTVMSGKTSYINTLISSILLSKKANEVKLMIYDSKKVDYLIYKKVPHLLCPIMSDLNKLNIALRNICNEIQARTEKLKNNSVKNIDIYNSIVEEHMKYPDLIVIIDDFSALNGNNEINEAIENITYNGWNVNIYVIIAVNHPSAKVISMASKLNFPARLSFKVVNSHASKIILDETGAEKLKSYGMALYTSRMNDSIVKIKVPYITDNDISKIVEYCCKEQEVRYSANFLPISDELEEMWEINIDDYVEPLYNEIVEFVVTQGKASASLLQRRFHFGYNRAARCIDLLEERGIVGPWMGAPSREVLVKHEDIEHWD